MKPFATFSQYFCPKSFATIVTYRDSVFLSLQVCASFCIFSVSVSVICLPAYIFMSLSYQEAAHRCQKQFSGNPEDTEDQLKQMLDWAFNGFKPTGPDGFKPAPINGKKIGYRPYSSREETITNLSVVHCYRAFSFSFIH